MTEITNQTLLRQLEYAFEKYDGFENIDLSRFLVKTISLYTLGGGGYWEANYDAVITDSDDEKYEDLPVAQELYDNDAQAIGGLMSSIPAFILILLRYVREHGETFTMNEEEADILAQIENVRGKGESYALLSTEHGNRFLNQFKSLDDATDNT